MEHNPSQFILYQSEDGQIKLDVRFVDETVWLTQGEMAALFQTSADNISLHLKNIYSEGELEPEATTEDFSVVRQEGARQVKRSLKHYNLDAIISVGYRVQSHTAIRFFKTVQNKMHWAITGQTAAEIVHARADSSKENMGVTNWRAAKVRKQDVVNAKNYLNEAELQPLNNLIE